MGDLVWFDDQWRQRLQRACVADALMRPMLVAEDLELAQGSTTRMPVSASTASAR
ncbi:hypothetical protein [Actinomadura napierensis]|uniref:hypothetical protein n=1 Tax=Actinomadura napierensis TaxID=267854 RepID=UPI0031DEE3AE